MEILIHRRSGFFDAALGRALPLSVFFNGIKVGVVMTGETKAINCPETEGNLQVGITRADEGLGLPHSEESKHVTGCTVSSSGYQIKKTDAGHRFECGTNWWYVFDVVGLYWIQSFGRHVFFVRKAAMPQADASSA